MDKAKPFDIPKREVWEAFKKVKANQGAAGVDGQSVADFEANLSRTGSLRKLSSDTWSPSWSRSSMRTPMGIGRAGRRSMLSGEPASDAGGLTGY